jgi:hypothetical protein
MACGCYKRPMAGPIRWFARAAGASIILYAALMLLGGVALRGCVEERVRERFARSLDADVAIGSSSLSVWRGEMILEDVTARREQGGALDLRIARVEAEVAGWGAVLFDRDLERLLVRGLRFEVSAAGLTGRPRSERRPMPVGELLIEDAVIAVAPTAILPSLGRVQLEVRRAHARDVQLSSALSWLQTLSELDASLSAPGDVGLAVRYAPGWLSLDGRVLGVGRSIRVPFRFPPTDPAAYEIDQLRAVAAAAVEATGKALLGAEARDAAWSAIRRLLD